MPIYETFSQRRKKLEQADKPIIFQYDSLPEPFRVQVTYIWHRAIGSYEPSYNKEVASTFVWQLIHRTYAEALGVFSLDGSDKRADIQCRNYLLKADTDGALGIIQLTFQVIDGPLLRNLSEYTKSESEITQDADDAIADLNHYFQEHGIGYEYVEGKLIRKDSQYLHAEAVKPALSLLQDQSFRGAEDEFLKAHEYHRKGDCKQAITEALKAFESAMKAICDARNWPYDKDRATAKPLIDIMLKQGLVPAYLQSHFTALGTVMEAGLPTLRNKTSGHGQGPNPVVIPEHFAAYALHLAAANIVFLVEAHKALN